VKRFIDEAYNSARDILASNRNVLTRIANALLEREVLDAQEIKMIIDGKELPARPSSHDEGGVQQVLKPAPGPQPGIVPGERPSPA
jgi:cell division protease FtsH